jgi:hypothetical protein
VPATAIPQSTGRLFGYGRGQNQPTTWHSSANGPGSLLGNSVTQSYVSTAQPANSNIRGPPPVKRSRKGSDAYRSIIKAKDTETPFSSKQDLWEGKPPVPYTKHAC